MMTTNKTTALSNFKRYLEAWDLNIESLDSSEEQEKMKAVIEETISFLTQQISEWENVSIAKDPSGENLLKLFENKKYKDFQRISGNLLWLKYRVDDLFEIKNRRTKQNYDLRAEIAESKIKKLSK